MGIVLNVFIVKVDSSTFLQYFDSRMHFSRSRKGVGVSIWKKTVHVTTCSTCRQEAYATMAKLSSALMEYVSVLKDSFPLTRLMEYIRITYQCSFVMLLPTWAHHAHSFMRNLWKAQIWSGTRTTRRLGRLPR